MPSELPAPDTTSSPSYHSEKVVEILFSDSKERRAVIAQDRDKHYRVHTDYWCLSDYEYIGEGYWSQDDRFATITDTLDSARKLAKEALHVSH
jgi:hypothetical protein